MGCPFDFANLVMYSGLIGNPIFALSNGAAAFAVIQSSNRSIRFVIFLPPCEVLSYWEYTIRKWWNADKKHLAHLAGTCYNTHQ